MKLRELRIKNFRSLRDVSLRLDDVTVLVGENNSGKTALLHAVAAALSRSLPNQGQPFDEYDYHMSRVGDSPQTAGGIVVELWFREDRVDEWPEPLCQALSDIIQTDPAEDLDSIGVRVTSSYDSAAGRFIPKWEFLNLYGQPLVGKAAQQHFFRQFARYIRFFYLSALRDSDEEFSPRSQYWGRILRDLRIPEEQRLALHQQLAGLNDELLRADPRLEQVRTRLENIQSLLGDGTDQRTLIQALPLKHWELMSRAQIAIQGRGNEVDFPLSRHGLGSQSLAVLSLFQAYIDVLLKPLFEKETEAILALEEPESHLHPQAIRALAQYLSSLGAQVLISTHSPFFIQEVPLANIRYFRRVGAETRVLSVPTSFTAEVPFADPLVTYCQNSRQKFAYRRATSTLAASSAVSERECCELLSFFPGQPQVHQRLKQLYNDSALYISPQELAVLDTFAKRVRGEIFFARAWLLCEGQSEYVLLRYFAEVMGKSLDQTCVSVIDFQNNGSAGLFVRLAKIFQVPWLLLCDNDMAAVHVVKQLKGCRCTEAELNRLVLRLPGNGMYLERFLCESGFLDDFLHILKERTESLDPFSRPLVVASAPGKTTKRDVVVLDDGSFEVHLKEGDTIQVVEPSDAGFATLVAEIVALELKKDKLGNANALVRRLRSTGADSARVPQFFASAINQVTGGIS